MSAPPLTATVEDCLGQHAPAYLARFGDAMPLNHRKVLGAITRCRTGELGGVLYQCDDCGRTHWVGRSCGNRHCPNCGKGKSYAWLEKQANRLMPVHHFLVTFTVPDQVRSVLRRNQRDGYAALFQAGAESIRDVGSATKSLRDCQLGFFVLDISLHAFRVEVIEAADGHRPGVRAWLHSAHSAAGLPEGPLLRLDEPQLADPTR